MSIVLLSVALGCFFGHLLHRRLFLSWFQRCQLGVLRRFTAFQKADSDEARQARILGLGAFILAFSVKLLLLMSILFAVAAMPAHLFDWSPSQQLAYACSSSVIAIAYIAVRRRHAEKADKNVGIPVVPGHGLLHRWLQWLALSPSVVRHLAFDVERQFALPRRPIREGPQSSNVLDPASNAVYVCGLARSGTTMLLRVLDQIEVFRSLNYSHMPFVLAPNLWEAFTRNFSRQSVLTERAHGDGIFVDIDSPEGFEEVFWGTFVWRNLDGGCMSAEEPSPEVMALFADYRALIANPRTRTAPSQTRRYLSKNNNNLARLRCLCADSSATVLLAYRDPVATALSLHRQHRRFCTAQRADPFIRRYMGWLAHFEFGLDHRPFCFALPFMDRSLNPEDPNYWLDYWNAVYRYVLAQADLPFVLVNHDALRIDPAGTLGALFSTIKVTADAASLARDIKPPTLERESADVFCPDLLLRAQATHASLQDSPKNILQFHTSQSNHE